MTDTRVREVQELSHRLVASGQYSNETDALLAAIHLLANRADGPGERSARERERSA